MLRALLFFSTVLLVGCSTQNTYVWQDTRSPEREDVHQDLEECKNYTARQYRPGIPKGEAFQRNRNNLEEEPTDDGKKEWHPDRTPFPATNIRSQPIHDIPVDYTGYPGQLDYSPGYLDEILEKCMLDRGWVFTQGKE